MNAVSPSPGGPFGPLFPYINPYLTQVRAQGFAVGSIYEHVCALKMFGRWLKRTGRGVRDIDEAVCSHFLRRVVTDHYPRNAAPATLRRLLAMLRGLGATPEPEEAPPTPDEQVMRGYERFLTEERNLAPPTVERLRRFATRFLTARFGGGTLNMSQLGAPDVSAFVQEQAHRHGPSQARQLVSATRSFLRYLHYRGLVDSNLSLAVPAVARWSLSTLPKHLSGAQVRQVLQHCDKRTSLGRRDHAILLLLARLGLRAGEVRRLELEDLDWDHGQITVCGKGKRGRLPLPADVARAIARYLRQDRPRCASRRVFIQDRAPLDGFHYAGAVADIVKRALARAGVASARKGTHLLRHSLATEMLRRGASLEEIGEILRHKGADSTAIYAKVDLRSLRALALPWPGGAR